MIINIEYTKYYYGMPVPIMRHHLPTDKGNYHNLKLIASQISILKLRFGVDDKQAV